MTTPRRRRAASAARRAACAPAADRRRAALAAALVALAGCKDGGVGDRTRMSRSDRDAPAVSVVDRAGGAGAGADRPPEREPNGDPQQAAPIGLGVRGNLDGETDVDVYALRSEGPRLLHARVSGMAGVDAKLELRDERFAVIVVADRGGAGVGEAFPNVSLDKGEYFLVVREIAHPVKPVRGKTLDAGAATGRAGPSPAYELTAVLSTDPPAGGEREPDDDAGSANDVALGGPVTGYLGWGGDVDVWKLAIDGLADGDGLDVAVSAVDKVALTVEVTDAGGRRLVRTTGGPGQPVTLRSLAPRVPAGEPTVQFIHVSGKPANPDATYQLDVTSRLLDLDEEAEPNDATGNPLRFGSEEQGTMRGELGPGDVDRFTLSPLAAAAAFDVVVDVPAGIDLTLEVTGAAAAKADRGGPGDAEQVIGLVVPAGGALALALAAKPAKKPASRSAAGPRPGPEAAAGAYQVRWSLTTGAAPPAPPPDQDPMPPDEDPMPPEE